MEFKDMTKCEICKSNCSGKLIVKDSNLLDKKTKDVKEWKLCSKCFNLWISQNYDELRKRIKNDD